MAEINKIFKNQLLKNSLSEQGKIGNEIPRFIENSILFRCNDMFIEEFKQLQNDFIKYLFSLVESGGLHRQLSYLELIDYLKNTYEGLGNLIEVLKRTREH